MSDNRFGPAGRSLIGFAVLVLVNVMACDSGGHGTAKARAVSDPHGYFLVQVPAGWKAIPDSDGDSGMLLVRSTRPPSVTIVFAARPLKGAEGSYSKEELVSEMLNQWRDDLRQSGRTILRAGRRTPMIGEWPALAINSVDSATHQTHISMMTVDEARIYSVSVMTEDREASPQLEVLVKSITESLTPL